MDLQENQTSLEQKLRILKPIQIHQLVNKIKLEICSILHIFANLANNPKIKVVLVVQKLSEKRNLRFCAFFQ